MCLWRFSTPGDTMQFSVVILRFMQPRIVSMNDNIAGYRSMLFDFFCARMLVAAIDSYCDWNSKKNSPLSIHVTTTDVWKYIFTYYKIW